MRREGKGNKDEREGGRKRKGGEGKRGESITCAPLTFNPGYFSVHVFVILYDFLLVH